MMQRDNYKILPFSPENAKAVEMLENECFSSPWSAEAILDSYNFNTVFFVATKNGNVVGYIGVQNIISEGYITNVAVSKKHRGNGVGALLVKKALEHCQEQNFEFLSLEVRASNTPAISLYTKLGFETVGERKNFYQNPTENAYIMTYYFNGR